MQFKLTTPVVLCIFSRLDTTALVFEKIREAKPEKLYIISDAQRPDRPGEEEKVRKVRDYVEGNIDWPCEVHKNYADSNMGCGRRIPSGLTWVFEQEEEAIILEDDCVPDVTFFRYCQEMLEYYRDNDDIFIISGNNPIAHLIGTEYDYTFTKIPFCWGWATWARTWKKYDFDIKTWPGKKRDPVWRRDYPLRARLFIGAELDELYDHKYDAWDYQLLYAVAVNEGLCVVPAGNHVFNAGFGTDSSHTASKPEWLSNEAVPVGFPIKHPPKIKRDAEFDRLYLSYEYKSGFIVHIKKLLGLDINRSIFDKAK